MFSLVIATPSLSGTTWWRSQCIGSGYSATSNSSTKPRPLAIAAAHCATSASNRLGGRVSRRVRPTSASGAACISSLPMRLTYRKRKSRTAPLGSRSAARM